MTDDNLDGWGYSKCPTCHIYSSNKFFRKVETYQIFVCSRCYRANKNGWSKEGEQFLVPHMKRLELPLPKRNENGFLPLEVYTVVEIVPK